jgi:hypothetical protein
LLLFGFRVPIVLNSSILAALISFVLLIKKKNRNAFFGAFKTKFFVRIFFSLLLISILYFVFSFVHGTNGQFLFYKTFIAQFVYILCAIVVSSTIVENDGADEIRILKLFLIIFSIQTVIQIVCFISPSIYEIVSLFQVEEAKEAVMASQDVGLFRGYSLAADLFFGLGAMYGMGFVLLFYLVSLGELRNKAIVVVIFILLLVGTVFTARTGFIGLLISFLYILIAKEISFLYVLKIIMNFILVLWLFSIVLVAFLPKEYFDIINDSIIPFAFEFLISFFDGGKVETSSTNHLMSMLEIPISLKTYLTGDGIYINNDGSFYRYTDSGFLRNILFWGFSGLSALIYYQVCFFWYKKKSSKQFCFLSLVLLYILILQIKGEAIGKIHMINIFLSCYYLAVRNDQKMSVN